MKRHRMNHTKRVAALHEIVRIYNMLQASKRDIDSFATKRRAHLDEALALLVPHVVPPKPTRHRRWAELRPQDQERIIAKLARKAVTDGADKLDCMMRDMGIVGPLIEMPSQTARDKRPSARNWRAGHATSDWRRFLQGKHPLPEGTPATRLKNDRHDKLRRFRAKITPDPGQVYIIDPEFVPGLHPDDTCWERVQYSLGEYYRVIAAQDVLRLNERFKTTYPLLAGNLYLADEAVNVEVYYCAMLHFPRKGDPLIRKVYIGRAVMPRGGKVEVTKPFSTSAPAFLAAQTAFTQAMSDILYREETA